MTIRYSCVPVSYTHLDGLDEKVTSEFVGYDKLTAEGKVVALATETELVNALKIGETGTPVSYTHLCV